MSFTNSLAQSAKPYSPSYLDRLVQVLIAGGLAGVLAGAVSRISMRVVALLSAETPGFSLEGTFFILLVFAVLGILAGLVYTVPDRIFPGPKPLKGLGYSLFLLALFAILLITADGEGELAMLGPTTILLIFAPVFLVYGLALDLILLRLEGKPVGQPVRAIGIPWVVMLFLLAILLLASLGTLYSIALPNPMALRPVFHSWGLSLYTVFRVRSLALVLVGLAFLGTAILLFWRRPGVRMAKLTALGLVCFAAAFFASRNIWLSLLGATSPGEIPSGLLRAGGYTAMLLLLATFPDGRFKPAWSRILVVLGGLWSLAWFLPFLPDQGLSPTNWPGPLPALIFVGGILLGSLAQILRYRQAEAREQAQTRWPVLAFCATTAIIGLLVLAISLNKDLGGWASPRLTLAPLFAFAPYLLPWIVIPSAIAYAVLQRGLWADDEAESHA